MTWIVGASTIFGYGALYSDVQVTYSDGHTIDLLQKAYPLSNFIAAGFSGSVRIGFMLLQSLDDFLRIPSDSASKLAWDPVWVSRNWAPIARSVFQNAPDAERRLGSQVLMVGVSPTENCGLGAKVYFTRYSWPEFNPGIMSRAIKICSIGSGAGIREYKQRIKPLFRLTSGILKAEVGQPGGWARQLGFSISRTLVDNPRKGISRHLHIFIIKRGEILLEQNNENVYAPDGSVFQVRMPSLARGWTEFQAMSESHGHDISCATC